MDLQTTRNGGRVGRVKDYIQYLEWRTSYDIHEMLLKIKRRPMKTKFPHIFPVNIDALEAIKTDEGHIWGYEVWLVNDKEHDVCCKLLIIFPGFLSSKHSHKTKWEYFQVLSGELDLHVWEYDAVEDCQTYKLESGKQHFIPENIYHRFETGTKQFVLLLEVSGFEDEQTEKMLPSEELY